MADGSCGALLHRPLAFVSASLAGAGGWEVRTEAPPKVRMANAGMDMLLLRYDARLASKQPGPIDLGALC